jgi:hypothetical protein
MGAVPAVRASLASLAKRVTSAISPCSLAAVRDAAAAFGEQPRRERGDERAEFGVQLVDGASELANAA